MRLVLRPRATLIFALYWLYVACLYASGNGLYARVIDLGRLLQTERSCNSRDMVIFLKECAFHLVHVID